MSSPAEHITVLPIIIGMVTILSFALLGRIGARKMGVCTTLGELSAGILVGNLSYYFGYDLMIVLRDGASSGAMARLSLDGYSWNEAAQQVLGPDAGSTFAGLLQGPQGNQYLQVSQAIDMFTHYGVMFVLFYVGLSTHVVERLQQRETDALKVAAMGAVCPMALGFLVIWVLMPEATHLEQLFVVATLATTGIAVTAPVFARLGRTHSREAQIVFRAAEWDDVLGLVILTIISGTALTGESEIGHTVGRAVLFFICAFGMGPYFLTFLAGLLRHLNVMEAKLFGSFIVVMVLASLAAIVQLSPVVGAFAAGLLMHESYFKTWADLHHTEHRMNELFAPLEVIILPIFFVLLGIQVKLELLFDWQVAYVTLALIAAALLGKWLSGFGGGKNVSRHTVGVGMMPRGQVGLAFAFIGKSLGVIDSTMFSVLVVVILATTIVAPLLLKRLVTNDKQAETQDDSTHASP